MEDLEFLVLAALLVWLLWRTRPTAQLSLWLRVLETKQEMEIETKLRSEMRIEKSEEAKKEEFEETKLLAKHYPFDLGVLYASGWGVEKDQNEALLWYRKAAENGDKRAQYNLAAAYFEGDGVPVDYATAYFWLKLSEMENGVEAVGELLPPAERADIDQRCRAWLQSRKR